jgi:hypothetical protein
VALKADAMPQVIDALGAVAAASGLTIALFSLLAH